MQTYTGQWGDNKYEANLCTDYSVNKVFGYELCSPDLMDRKHYCCLLANNVRYLPYRNPLVEVTGKTNHSYMSDGNFWILMWKIITLFFASKHLTSNFFLRNETLNSSFQANFEKKASSHVSTNSVQINWLPTNEVSSENKLCNKYRFIKIGNTSLDFTSAQICRFGMTFYNFAC